MVERQPSKLGVAGSSPVSRSIFLLTRVQPLSTPSAFARFLRFPMGLANSVKVGKKRSGSSAPGISSGMEGHGNLPGEKG